MFEFQYTTTDGEVRYILAPDLMTAAYSAAELSGGTINLQDVRLTNGKAQVLSEQLEEVQGCT